MVEDAVVPGPAGDGDDQQGRDVRLHFEGLAAPML